MSESIIKLYGDLAAPLASDLLKFNFTFREHLCGKPSGLLYKSSAFLERSFEILQKQFDIDQIQATESTASFLPTHIYWYKSPV